MTEARRFVLTWPLPGEGRLFRVEIPDDATPDELGLMQSVLASDEPWTAGRAKRPAPKVLDADGVEIRVGDVVYNRGVVGERSIVVEKVNTAKWIDVADGPALLTFRADELTHTPPREPEPEGDSWERIENEAVRLDASVLKCDGARGLMHAGAISDLVRRAKALGGGGE